MNLIKAIIKYSFVLLTFLGCHSCDFFGAGSYPYAERYEFETFSPNLIEKIKDFKEKNPEYKVFKINSKGELYEPGGYIQNKIGEATITSIEPTENAEWFSFYFYFNDIKASVHCVINLMGDNTIKTPTIINLTGITYSQNFAEWKEINTKDLTKEENKAIKKKFETEILDHLGKWERTKWYE